MIGSRWISALAALVLCAGSAVARDRAGATTVIVIPARPAVAALAFDMARLRDVPLVCYQISPKTKAAVVYVWNANEKEWIKTDLKEYGTGAIFDPMPTRAILIGTDEAVMAQFEKAAGWGKVARIPTLSIMDVVNGLNEKFSFTPSEWVWLADRHGLKLKDLNTERRRWGRYGPPGQEKPRPSAAPVSPKTKDVAPEEEVTTEPLILPEMEADMPVTTVPLDLTRTEPEVTTETEVPAKTPAVPSPEDK